MLQKKVRKPIGFGSVVEINNELKHIRSKRKKYDKGSRMFAEHYHVNKARLIIVGGFVSSNGQKYFKTIRLNTNHNGYNYIDYNSMSIIHSKFVYETGDTLNKIFEPYNLKAHNDEAYKRFKREFV